MVTPDIQEIIKKSLTVGKNLMFYLPRNIDIKELFDLLNEATKQDIIFLDVYMLESANKIKAILLIYGVEPTISKLDMRNFISLIINNENIMSVKLTSKSNSFTATTKESEESEVQDITKISKQEKKDEVLYDYLIDKTPAHFLMNSNKENQIYETQIFKISLVIGAKKFFESLLKYKEKVFPKELNKCFNLHFGEINPEHLISYFCSEILTSRQISRIQ